MSIQQSTQPQVIDIRNSKTKVHVNGFDCLVLTTDVTDTEVLEDDSECTSVSIGDVKLTKGDIILGVDINIKMVLPFKINKIAKFDMSKDMKSFTFHSFAENPTKLFLAPIIGSIAFKIMDSPLYLGVFAYHPELNNKKYRYAVHFLLHYNKQIRDNDKFKDLKKMIEDQCYDYYFDFTTPFNNDNYIVLSIESKVYWKNDYDVLMRSQYSLVSPNYLAYLKTYLSKTDYVFISSIVSKSEILIKTWEEKLNMTIPKDAELFQAFDLENKDGLYESQLISKQEYERVKNLAGYMV